jgi:hypothetical protein
MGSFVVNAKPLKDEVQHMDFFESKIRPVLINHCYECHSANAANGTPRSGLRLDSLKAVLKGGEKGPAIVLGKPNESRMIRYVRHQGKKMPALGKPKLAESQIVALAKWVELGAPWPKAKLKPTKDSYDWSKARKHWAWQPVRKVKPPAAGKGARVLNHIDQFIAAGLRKAGLKQAQPVKAPMFVRRVFLDLIGLPPTLDEWRKWTERLGGERSGELNEKAVIELVDALLSRPQYGEPGHGTGWTWQDTAILAVGRRIIGRTRKPGNIGTGWCVRLMLICLTTSLSGTKSWAINWAGKQRLAQASLRLGRTMPLMVAIRRVSPKRRVRRLMTEWTHFRAVFSG